MKVDGAYRKLEPKELHGLEASKIAPAQLSQRVLLAVLLLLLTFFILLLFLLSFHLQLSVVHRADSVPCADTCRIVLVESIPEGMSFSNWSSPNPSTFSSWRNLLAMAQHSLDIASFYWTMTNEDTSTQEPSAAQGEQILEELLSLPRRGVALRVAVSPSRTPSRDLQALQSSGAAVRAVDLPRLTGGVLHTKFWLLDGLHLYLGSANMDWRSLTQVKELGVVLYNCSCLAQDLGKIFEAYWALGVPGATIPQPWPANYSTSYNLHTPLEVKLNGTSTKVYFSSSPPPLCASGRTQDLEALLHVIDDAQEFVDVAVMSYLPSMEFSHPERFWPAIDDALRRAVFERRVRVRLLVACWPHSKLTMFPFLKSLAAITDHRATYSLHVRLLVVPSSSGQARIPYARVNHNKYMLSDRAAYLGTSNWSGDYFTRTAGSALVLNQTTPGSPAAPSPAANSPAAPSPAAPRPGAPSPGGRSLWEQLQAVFERDWSSQYSVAIGEPERWQQFCGWQGQQAAAARHHLHL